MADLPESDISHVIDPLFRSLSGQLTATLTRLLGTSNIDTAEAIVQDAFVKACELWPRRGIPENPAGWITTVAKNLAIDSVRRQSRMLSIARSITRSYEERINEQLSSIEPDRARFLDDQLQMMLLTCHPHLPRRSRVMLTLRLAGGFSVPEISRAFLASEDSVRKSITRAKQAMRETEDPFEWPDPEAMRERTEIVLEVLYTIFNEGYSANDPVAAFRAELCDEAIRLTRLLVRGSQNFSSEQTIFALLALMLLQSSRISARVSDSMTIVLLSDQDRSKWDRRRINEGLRCLEQSIGGETLSTYHLEAQIAAAHAVAQDYRSTDWKFIAELYDRLYGMTGNPVIGLNRAVAVAEAFGAEKGLDELIRLEHHVQLSSYYLYFAALGDLYRRVENDPLAIENYQKALALVPSDLERAFLKERIAETSEDQNNFQN